MCPLLFKNDFPLFLTFFTLNFYLDTKIYGASWSPWMHSPLSQLFGCHSWVPNLLPYVECAKHKPVYKKKGVFCI